MRKEIIFAIFAGALFGLVIAFGIWKANTSMTSGDEPSDMENAVSEVTPTANPDVGITIAKPEQNEVLSEPSVKISGITKANSWVAISAENDDYLVKAASNGTFVEDVDLITGVNEIIITTFDVKGDSSQERLLLVYSKEFPIE